MNNIKVVNKKIKEGEKIRYYKTCSYCGEIVDFVHGERPSSCPHCGAIDFIKPKTETKLFLLQKKYFDHNRSQDALGDMYILLEPYAESLLKKMLPKSFTYHYDLIAEKAHDAVTSIIEYYLTKPSFKIEKSFAGYLSYKLQQVLWNKKDVAEDNHSSIHQDVNDDIEKEILDTYNLLSVDPLFRSISDYQYNKIFTKDMVDTINEFLDQIFQIIKIEKNYFYMMKFIIGLYTHIINRDKINDYYSIFGSYTKQDIDNSMGLLYSFIKEEIEE